MVRIPRLECEMQIRNRNAETRTQIVSLASRRSSNYEMTEKIVER